MDEDSVSNIIVKNIHHLASLPSALLPSISLAGKMNRKNEKKMKKKYYCKKHPSSCLPSFFPPSFYLSSAH